MLNTEEIDKVNCFKSQSRKREFIATRVLCQSIFGGKTIAYNCIGAPYIKGIANISISHAGNLAAIGVNDSFTIGLDLEKPRPNILELAPKFLSDNERNTINCIDELLVTQIWSCKEAMYKLAGRKQLIFATDLLIETEEDDSWRGRIINEDHELSFKLDIFEHEDTIVTLNASPVERIERYL